jgi:hypothetical protein
LDALDPEEQERLKRRAERILGDVHGLAQGLRNDAPGGPMVADMLAGAVELAPGAPLFSVGGKPVAVLWGHRAPGAVARQPSPAQHDHVTAASVRSQGSPTRAATRPASDANALAMPRRWLAPALFALAALALVAWGWMHFSPGRGGADSAGDDLSEQIAAAETRNRTLETRIAELKSKPAGVKCIPAAK